jgi:hypothetical protein
MVEPAATVSRFSTAPVACVELDRFCEECGYNLRTLAIHRDQRTGVAMVRCPECGRYHPANDAATPMKPWMLRVTSVMLLGWILTLVWMYFMLGAAEVGLSMGMLDELTHSGTYRTIQTVGGTRTITMTRGYGPIQLRPRTGEDNLFIGFMYTMSLVVAFATGMLAVVTFPHWRRIACIGVVTALPLIAGTIVAVAWRYHGQELWFWGMQHVVAHAGTQLLGGLIGVMLGRPFARAAVNILLPPSVRPRLAYLWLADKKPFPGSLS